ncbi:MAG: phosphonoacetaldehyde reductase [Devosia sp.]|uniref:phosphonoacetaldehyde reductase n=1 Tax=Devosia sp. TaxID=1871048 RepID=UPI0024C7200C|nr:phosphonoacetaldehyde reductase [Devosia sp.]UYO00435.1 MAG: phosphonoacetaldehyde reductase [Devosia sp.]
MSGSGWAFHNPTRVHFGAGAREKLGPMLAGKSVLVVTTRRGRAQLTKDRLLGASLPTGVVFVDTVLPNPGLADLQAGIDALSDRRLDCVVGFGGGSALDAAKAYSVALAGEAPTRTLQTLIERPSDWSQLNAIPLIALPTTSGTGSEVTSFATVWDHENRRKLSLAGPAVSPHTAIVDPELTHGLPMDATASTGLDALNQACESAWNRNASPVTLAMAGRAIGLALRALSVLQSDLGNEAARAELAEASLLAGLCISQTRTALCHSMSYPITAHFGVSHGYACAFTMSAVAERAMAHDSARFDDLARVAGYSGRGALLSAIADIVKQFDVSGIVRRAVPDSASLVALTGEMVTPGRADNYIVPLAPNAVGAILEQSYSS